jgi:uncharacterized protein (DUF885 family)
LNSLHRLTITVFFLLLLVPVHPAQTLPAAPSVPGMPPFPTSLDDRRKALAKVAHDYWEDVLKHSPELASALGDKRYNDQLSNYTSGAYNDQLSREQGYLMQLAVIDLAGFTEDEKQQDHLLMQRFEEDQQSSNSKPWETPISAQASFYAAYPQLGQVLSFTTDKDYEDWTARLHLIPEVIAQTLQDMSLGIDEGRIPPKDVADKALAEVSALAGQKAEESPFSAPLKKFPSSITPAEQERLKQNMLEAVNKDALTSYLRLERFLSVSYVPASAKGSAIATTRDAQLLAAVLNLRAKARQSLGPKFDVKAFHDEVMKTGLLPLDQMQNQVESWITTASKAP